VIPKIIPVILLAYRLQANRTENRIKNRLLVIDRKRIFWFRPKTNIWQENAAEYSADNEYSAQGSKHYKKVKFASGKKNLRVAVASSS
jgi:hypothetical protein